jgi:arylsulfatase A-like enzyme
MSMIRAQVRLTLVVATLAVSASLAFAERGSAQATGSRPNVVFIMTDDAGYGDLGSYGGKDIRTPNLDRLAREGVRLTDFYANAPSCTPTRAGLISGRYQQRSGLEYPLGMQTPSDYDRGLPVTGRSLPQLMKNVGYATALVGKWHLGWKPEFSPIRHGFDYFFGFKAGFIDFYTHTSGDSPSGADDLYENDEKVKQDGYMTDLITDRSMRFIRDNAQKPFFIDISYNAPHWPYQRPDMPSVARDNARHLSPFDDSTSTRADYAAMLERVDQGVGKILQTLDQLGLRNNTIVIFTNDNGGEWLSRNAPLFNHKLSVWEGGIRVPAIVRWPARIPAGRVSNQVGMTMDITASLLAVAGVATNELKLDGMNIFPMLEGRSANVERTLFWRAHAARQQRAVRSGDWKLVIDMNRPMLFNLRTDISERENLAGKHPDIARRLRDQLLAWEKDVDGGAKP